MKSHEDPSIIIKVFEGEDQDLDFFKDSFSYQVKGSADILSPTIRGGH